MLLSKIISLDNVDSTNNYTANLIKEGKIKHGTAILSYNQQFGRGQRGTNWQSEPFKNIAFSLYVVHQNMLITSQRYFNYAVSLAIVDLLRTYEIQAQVKWPNDILVNDQKIAGILIENQLNSSGWNSSIIGIGLNVNQVFDSQQGFSATSLTNLLNRVFKLDDIVYQLAEKLSLRYAAFTSGLHEELESEFLENMWKIGEFVNAEINEVRQLVKICGMDEYGWLKLEVAGEVRSFDLKEVKFIY